MLTVLRYPYGYRTIKSAARMATGRSAILHFMRRWNPSHVYMPAYVPEGVIKPCQAHGAEVVFYRLQQDLDIDLADLETCLKKHGGERPVIVSIYYFGFSVSKDLRALADKYGAIIMGDRAHGSWDHIASDDVVLFSYNKMIPVTDGALIATTRDDLDLSVGPLPKFSEKAAEFYRQHLAANTAIGHASDKLIVSAAVDTSAMAYDLYYDIISKDMEPAEPTSESEALIAETIWAFWVVERAKRSGVLNSILDPSLIVRDAPAMMAYPIRCNQQRDDMIEALFHVGVLPHVQRDLWDHLPNDDRFRFEREFLEDHLLLPIEVRIGLSDLESMARAVNKFAEKRVLQ